MSTMTFTSESLQTLLPYYLTQDQKNGVLKGLKDFPDKMQYYTMLHEKDVLQGDCWAELEIINFEDGVHKKIKGIILSNSCDIDPSNKREIPPKITFAPIISLSSYEKLLQKNGVSEIKINNKFEAIRNQQVSNIFYLPKGGALDGDYFALLDDLHTFPYHIFEANPKREKICTLSLVGFYMFLFKLSFHFCRFHENIHR